MPLLPTPEVTQAEYDRLLEPFESEAAFLDWVTGRIVEHATLHEARKIDEEANIAKRDRLAAFVETLPKKEPKPPKETKGV